MSEDLKNVLALAARVQNAKEKAELLAKQARYAANRRDRAVAEYESLKAHLELAGGAVSEGKACPEYIPPTPPAPEPEPQPEPTPQAEEPAPAPKPTRAERKAAKRAAKAAEQPAEEPTPA